jgi:hypothetical protein
MKNLLRNLRDVWPSVAMIVIAALLFYFVSWWAGLIGIVLLYWHFRKLTYMQAIKAIQQMTGLDYYRANELYKAGITGNWSEIKTSELRVERFDPTAKGPQKKLREQLTTLIIIERSKRNTYEEFEKFFRKYAVHDKALRFADVDRHRIGVVAHKPISRRPRGVRKFARGQQVVKREYPYHSRNGYSRF